MSLELMRLPVAGPIHVFVGAGGPLFALFPVLEVAVYGIPSDCCDPDPWRPQHGFGAKERWAPERMTNPLNPKGPKPKRGPG